MRITSRMICSKSSSFGKSYSALYDRWKSRGVNIFSHKRKDLIGREGYIPKRSNKLSIGDVIDAKFVYMAIVLY